MGVVRKVYRASGVRLASRLLRRVACRGRLLRKPRRRQGRQHEGQRAKRGDALILFPSTLAIEAYLGAYDAPPGQQLEKRLRDWFAATERHALQLREIDENEYFEMKRREVVRPQQTAVHLNE